MTAEKRRRHTQRYPIGKGSLFVFDGIFDPDTVQNFANVVATLPFVRRHSFDEELNCPIDKRAFAAAPFLYRATEALVMRYKPKMFSGGQRRNKLSGVYAAAIDSSRHTKIHQDQPCFDCVTFLYFANAHWMPDWGGETIFYDTNRESVQCVQPRPGRLVLFNSGLLHRAGVPQRDVPSFRYTVSVFYYCDRHGSPGSDEPAR